MTEQPSPFDLIASQEAKHSGMAQVERNANEAYLKRALEVAYHLCQTNPEFTCDDLNERMSKEPVKTHDLRILGTILPKAAKQGWCEITDRYQPSRNRKNHASPRRIWVSLIYHSQPLV